MIEMVTHYMVNYPRGFWKDPEPTISHSWRFSDQCRFCIYDEYPPDYRAVETVRTDKV